LACSTLNSQRVFGRHELRRPVEEIRGDLGLAPVDVRLDGPAVDEQGERGPHGRVSQEGMHGRDAGALAVDLGSTGRSG